MRTLEAFALALVLFTVPLAAQDTDPPSPQAAAARQDPPSPQAAAARPGAAAEIRDERTRFLEALAQFTSAIEGTYGDEGPAVWSSLDTMQAALRRWDNAIRTYETEQPPFQRADGHIALAMVYVDRSRLEDALEQLAAAARLAPRRAESTRFRRWCMAPRTGRRRRFRPSSRRPRSTRPIRRRSTVSRSSS